MDGWIRDKVLVYLSGLRVVGFLSETDVLDRFHFIHIAWHK